MTIENTEKKRKGRSSAIFSTAEYSVEKLTVEQVHFSLEIVATTTDWRQMIHENEKSVCCQLPKPLLIQVIAKQPPFSQHPQNNQLVQEDFG